MIKIIFKFMIIVLLSMISWKDWKTKRIPDKYVLGICLTGIISIWLIPEITLFHRVMGVFAVSAPLLILTCIVPGSIGGGDIKLMAAGGFLLGIAEIWHAFEIAVFCAGGYVLYLVISRKTEKESEIALGPFLSTGMIYVLMKI